MKRIINSHHIFRIAFLVVLSTNPVIPQVQEQETITVLPFSGWRDSNRAEAKRIQEWFTDDIINRIKRSHRFMIIDQNRFHQLLGEHQIILIGRDYNDEAVLAETGRAVGVDKFVIGLFTQNSIELHKGESENGELTEPYYTAAIQATVKIFDIASASFIERTEVSGNAKGKSRSAVLYDALDRLAARLMIHFEQYFAVQAYITSIDKSTVVLDRGYALGVREGSTYKAVKPEERFIDPASGGIYIEEQSFAGVIYIDEVATDYAKGRIIKGKYSINEDMLVVKRVFPLVRWGLSVAYAPLNISVKPNNIVGTYTISDRYTGSHEVNIDYTACEEITGGWVIQVSAYRTSLAHNEYLGITFNRYGLPDNLNAWSLSTYLGKDWVMVPYLLYISPAVGIGFREITQSLPGGIVSEISDGTRSELKSPLKLALSAQLAVKVRLGNILLFTEGSYRMLKASKWVYYVKTGKKVTESDDGCCTKEVDEVKPINFDPNLAAYPQVDLSGVYFRIGVAMDWPVRSLARRPR